MPFRGGADAAETDQLHLRRINALFDRLPALVAYWDRDLRNVIANAAYTEWFGLSPAQMHGMHIRDVLGPETYAKNLPYIEGVLGGEEQSFERTLVDPVGRVLHTQATYLPDLVDGQNYGFFVLVTDVTAQVEAQRALDEAQLVAELGSWSWDLESGSLTWSDELYRILGLSPGSVVPTLDTILTRVDPADRARAEELVERARRTGEPYEVTYRIHRADGELREFYSRGRAHTTADGTVVRLAGTVQDATRSNAVARELARVNADLVRSSQLNADVLAMLGHDIRAPLTVIVGYLEQLLGTTGPLPSQYREFLTRAHVASRELGALVENILAMARVDSGQIVAHPDVVPVTALVRQVLDGVQHGDTVLTDVHGDPHVLADPFHCRQILSNLVTNAFRYGRPPVVIRAEVARAEHVTIAVTDHGPGVAEASIPTIFDRFVAGTTARSDGSPTASTGFGLYIAAGLATANGGSLTYDGTGPGATFALRLPAHRGRDRFVGRVEPSISPAG